MKLPFNALLCLAILSLHQNIHAQFLSPTISFGFLSTDIHDGQSEREMQKRLDLDFNASKTGFFVGFGSGIKVSNWFNIATNVNYQERLPLESFSFEHATTPGEASPMSRIVAFPTSPQSLHWNSELYSRLPNFRYVYLEVIPTITLGNPKLKAQLGIGAFYGHLLNQNKLQFSYQDFPFFENLAANTDPSIIDSYNRDDFGWLPRLSLASQLFNRTTIGLTLKSYISEFSLRREKPIDAAVTSKWGRQHNTTWMVYALGLDLTHTFGERKL